MRIIARIRIWFANLFSISTLETIMYIIASFVERLGRAIYMNIVIGIILNVVATHFWPELPERIPIIFGVYDGFMQFGEFMMKSAFGYINAFFHGNAIEFLGEIDEQIQAMWIQFVNWLNTIHF